MAGLPISRLVSVSVSLTSLLLQEVPINSILVLGSSNVIDTEERMRTYGTLDEIAQDFSTTSPEYLSAVPWFGQSPQPTTISIGRWAKSATRGRLVGGLVASANLLTSAWTPITSGAFLVYVNGIPCPVTGINLGSVTNLNGVASAIETALQATDASAVTVLWNAVYDRFEFYSALSGALSSFGFLMPPAAVGKITFAGQPANNDTVTIKGTTVTFVTGTPTGNQVQIGATLANTITNLLTFLNASTDVNLSAMSYTQGNDLASTVVYIVSDATGTTGNSYTLAKAGTNITVSGATLTGGVSTANDISTMLAATATSSGAYSVAGIVAESALNAVTVFDDQFGGQWYGLFIPEASDADHEAVAAYVEGANPPHYYGVNTQNADALLSNSTSDIAYVLSNLKYNKTCVQYSSRSQYAVMSYLARILTTDWLGSNTTITLMYKDEPGIVAETLTSSQADTLLNKHCNAIAQYERGQSFIQYGMSASGQLTDTVIGADWLSGHAQTGVFNVLRGTSTKIPQTDAGVTMLLNAIEAACQDGVNNGYLGRGLPWNSSGFGTLKSGQILDKGFYVYANSLILQTQAVRQTRAAPLIQVAAKTAGAIHTADITIYVQP